MYLQEIPENVKTTTLIKIKYDCCEYEHTLKHVDAAKNFKKNNSQHICRPCWLKSNNPAKRKEVREKMKATCLERYGSEMPLNSKENIKKRNEEMFTPERMAMREDKRKKTCQEKYGAEHHMKTDAGKETQRKGMQEKHGVDHPYQSLKIMEKMKAANLKKHGAENVAQLPEVRKKMAKTSLERHGVEHYNQLPEMKDYLREHCTEWLADSYATGGPMKGITRPEEWNQKQRETVIQLMDEGKWKSGPKHTLKGHYQSTKCHRQNPMFRSSYELKTHWHLDHDPEVEWYDYEPFQIAYYDTEGKKRYYVIDFVIKFKSGRMLAVEVKNNYTQGSEATKLKYNAFTEHCGNIFEHEFWACDKIKSLNIDLEELLESKKIELL